MTNNEHDGPARLTCEVTVAAPKAVDAGTDFTIQATVTSVPPANIQGSELDVRADGATVARGIALVDCRDGGCHTDNIRLNAPRELGAKTWRVVLPSSSGEEFTYEEASTPFTFDVQAHRTRLTVWGVPSAVRAGETYEVHVGMKCSSGCDLSGREFEIVDEEDRSLTTGRVGQDPWPGTTGLHYAKVPVEAPHVERYFRWKVRSRPLESALPHDQSMAQFGIHVVPAPSHTVRVHAIDLDTREPIEGLHVLMHPFRAFTGEDGVAEIEVPEGEYRLYLSGLRYFPHDTSIDVRGDVSKTAELKLEKRPLKIT